MLILVMVMVILIPSTSFAEFRNYEFESLRINLDTDWPQSGAAGYFPVRIDINNLGEAREVEVLVTSNHWFDPYRRRMARSVFGGVTDAGRMDTRRLIRLKRGDRVKFTMPIPVFADNERFQIRFRENGKTLETANFASFQSGRSLPETPVLVAATPGSVLDSAAGDWLRPMPPAHSPYGATYPTATRPVTTAGPRLDYILDPERLPDTWLGFTTLRAVALGPTEWAQLKPVQQDALLNWTASGGDLIYIDGTLDSLLPVGQSPLGVGGLVAVRPYLLGNIHLQSSETIRQNGFVSTIDAMDNLVATPDWSLPAVRSRDWGWIAERGFRLPIEGAGYVPSRAYLAILVLFVLLIGPANYYYLWRKRQQVLMVLTVPLISAAFIGLLAGYGIISEGFSVKSRAITFTMLDQNAKKSATRASVSLYPGGITPGGGIRFASDAAILPLGPDGNGARGQIALNLNDEQRYSSGFLQPRTPANFEQILFQPSGSV